MGCKTLNNPDGTTVGELRNLLCWAKSAISGFAQWNDTGFDKDAGLSYQNLSEAVNQADLFLAEQEPLTEDAALALVPTTTGECPGCGDFFTPESPEDTKCADCKQQELEEIHDDEAKTGPDPS